MGKRYYCDFCDKSFPDNSENRKKHNDGTQHQLNRVRYYSNNKDLATILYEERSKRPCPKFLTGQHCAFGELCRCSHRTREEIEQLENLYRIECHNKANEFEEYEKEAQEENIRQLRKRCRKFSTKNTRASDFLTKEAKITMQKFLPQYELPKCLKAYDKSILPASLFPPSFKDLIDYPFNEFVQ